jgi:hypothetical protein
MTVPGLVCAGSETSDATTDAATSEKR